MGLECRLEEFQKTPAEIIEKGIDWSAWLDSQGGHEIATSVWTIASIDGSHLTPAMVINSDRIDANKKLTFVSVSNGTYSATTANTNLYLLENTITTNPPGSGGVSLTTSRCITIRLVECKK